jgi:uncharacterized membrane protein
MSDAAATFPPPSEPSDSSPPAPGPAAFHTAMAHLYRAEMHRMTVWRQRLDVTSNWAILLTMGLTTFTLGSAQLPHFILLLGLAALAISIVIEARRYRHLHHSQWRLHVMERGYFDPLLKGADPVAQTRWKAVLSKDLQEKRYLIGLFAAARVRLRRNYLLLVYFITGVWITKLFVHPQSPQSIGEFYGRFAVGDLIPPWFVVASAAAFIGGATLLAMTCPSAETLESRYASRCGSFPDFEDLPPTPVES